MIAAILIILTLFGGIAIAAVAIWAAIQISDGEFTLPGTDARRIKRAETALALKELEFKRNTLQSRIDAQIDARLTLALGTGQEDT